MTYIDLAFRLVGKAIPVDHGYALYSAVSRVVPEIHNARQIGIHPIRGIYQGSGALLLAAYSRLILRLPDEEIKSYLKVAGKRLTLDGHAVTVGVPEVRMLRPVTSVRSRLVTIKGFQEPETFLQAAQRQLDILKVSGELLLGERKTFRVKEKQIVGFELAVSGLTVEQSLNLQEKGLGGRRRMGCGVFVPRGTKRRD
jgi:CRISPR-associated protein Cas6